MIKINKYSIDHYIDLASKNGYQFMDKEIPKNTKTKCAWLCIKGNHTWITTYHSIQCGNNCYVCTKLDGTRYISQRKPNEQFIKEAIQVHGNKYDYSKVNYINCSTKVSIICSVKGHGEFWQEPKLHVHKVCGCPKCGSKTKSTIEYINQAIQIHDDRYDYSKLEYISRDTKVCIICKIDGHGEFFQDPWVHLNGSGCTICAINEQKNTLDDFIINSRKVHGDKYDYSKVKYVRASANIIIICKKKNHGEFLQSPGSHINSKNGCPKCASGRSEEICRELIEDLTGKQFTKIRPDWLNKLELDGYNDELKLAFEYQGKQHTHFIPHFHKDKSYFIDQVARDTLKRQLCEKNGIQVIEVPYAYTYKEPYRMKVFIMIELEKHGYIFKNGNYTNKI
jgi:hypothetical protein